MSPIYTGKGTLFDYQGRALGTVTDMEVMTLLVNESDAHLFKDVSGVNVEVYKGPATTGTMTVTLTPGRRFTPVRHPKVRKVAQWKRERR